MKKTLVAVALLGAFGGSALAADITLYGRIDTGLAYMDGQAEDDWGNKEKVHSAQMTSGFLTGSRWGIKGTEELGNGLKVGFVLENGFSSDDGKLGQGDRLFGREALVSVGGDFGTFYMGRMGSIVSDAGSISILAPTSVFGDAIGNASMKLSTGAGMARHDNVVAYVSPSFGGLDVRAMYSMKSESADAWDENSGDTNRYAAVGLNYQVGPVHLVLAGDYIMYGNLGAPDAQAPTRRGG